MSADPVENLGFDVLRGNPLTSEFVDDLERLYARLMNFEMPPIVRGHPNDLRGLSWRCRAIAYANVLRVRNCWSMRYSR